MADTVQSPKHTEAELDDFLSKIEEIETTIKGLNTDDEGKRGEFMAKADRLIEKVESEKEEKAKRKEKEEKKDDVPELSTGFSRTVINKDAYKNEPAGPPHPGPMGQPQGPPQDPPVDQAAFMAAMEADARERAERRKEREKVAAVLKEQGNAEFKQGSFENALDFYNQAIQQVKDSSALYTNRAQTHIKLGHYKEALSDCDWALRAWPNCVKAYVHQGHAHLALGHYEEARDSYREILTLDDRKEAMVKDYLADVDRMEQANLAEEKASQLFESGDQTVKSVVELMAKVAKTDQLPLYYAGGFRVIASVLDSVDTQTLFRTQGGLQLPVEHAILARYLGSSLCSLSAEERDVIVAALDMLTAACKDNETNQQNLMALPSFSDRLMAILELKVKGHGRNLRSSCLTLLHEVSTTSAGMAAIVTHFDLARLIASLFPLMTKTAAYSSAAAAIFNNIALDKRVKSALRGNIEESILPAFENLLSNNKTFASIASLASTTATNLATDPLIRKKMAARETFWRVMAQNFAKHTEASLTEPVESVLGLLVNVSTGVEPSTLRNLPTRLCTTCCLLLAGPPSATSLQRALSFLSNVCLHCASFADYLRDSQRVALLVDHMKSEDATVSKPALKCLVSLSKDSPNVCQQLADLKVTSLLLTFLNSEDEITLGNAAVCLSHLTVVQKVCAKLTRTNIIQKLLTLARDARNVKVQSNCAILLGKLVQGDQRHYEKLQELEGMQILHNCMRHIQS